MACTADDHTVKSAARCRGSLYSLAATLLLWAYFLGMGIMFVCFCYLPAFVVSRDKEAAFQHINSLFFRWFLRLVRLFFPMHGWLVDEDIATIRSSIVVCNHLSYLDPLILVALFPRQKTIVKSKFFNFPVFGWLLRVSGYLPATTEGRFGGLMIKQMEKMESFLAAGGIVFIFPEGTRSKTGHLGEFRQGAFKIARLCRAPLEIITLCNSDALFPPGRFMFSAVSKEAVSISRAGRIEPDYTHTSPPASTLAKMAGEHLRAAVASCRVKTDFSKEAV